MWTPPYWFFEQLHAPLPRELYLPLRNGRDGSRALLFSSMLCFMMRSRQGFRAILAGKLLHFRCASTSFFFLFFLSSFFVFSLFLFHSFLPPSYWPPFVFPFLRLPFQVFVINLYFVKGFCCTTFCILTESFISSPKSGSLFSTSLLIMSSHCFGFGTINIKCTNGSS